MSILIWIIPLGVFIFCIAYICGYIYGTNRTLANLVQAAQELRLEEVFKEIVVRGKEIVERKHE